EERYVASCLDSILATTYPSDRLEVLIVDGMSEDRTRPIVAAYAKRHRAVRLIDNSSHITPAGLNAGIRAARGDVIVRMDAHVVYPPDYIALSVAALEQTGADNVGPVIVTRPADGNAVARAIAVALSHPFGVGNSHFRIGSRERRQVARMWYQYGYFKPLVAKKVRRVMTLRQLVPACFVLGLVGTAALSPWLPVARVAFGALGLAYAALAVGCGLAAARKQGLACAFTLPFIFVTIHTSYGLGFLP